MSELTKLKIDYSKMAEQIKNLCKEQGEIKDDLRAYITEDRTWKEERRKEDIAWKLELDTKLDTKYAGKWVEADLKKIMWGIIGVVSTIIVFIFTNILNT